MAEAEAGGDADLYAGLDLSTTLEATFQSHETAQVRLPALADDQGAKWWTPGEAAYEDLLRTGVVTPVD